MKQLNTINKLAKGGLMLCAMLFMCGQVGKAQNISTIDEVVPAVIGDGVQTSVVSSDAEAKLHNPSIGPNNKPVIFETSPLREEILKRFKSEEKIVLDLFVMSKCPFGVFGEEAAMKLVKEFGNKIELRLNFIAGEQIQDGKTVFNSMHGQPEVDEDIRQLVIARDYPEKFMAYLEARTKDYQNDNWQNAANKAGIDVQAFSIASTGTEAEHLLSENIKYAQKLNIGASPTLLINGERFAGPIFDETVLSSGTLFRQNRPSISDAVILLSHPFSPFPEAAAPAPSPLPAPPPPIPPACTTGSDPFTGANYVVCASTATTAWISSVSPFGTYHSLYICNSLGYSSVGLYGGTCGSVCGYCTGGTSCSSPGTAFFDGAGLQTPDIYGQRLGSSVTWQCLGALSNAAPTFNGGSPQSLTLCQNAAATSLNTLLRVNDADVGQTLTWTVTSSPAHGTLSGVASYTATSTGGTITPTGMTYTPTSGYAGTDAFTIQVSDGAATASTTINVTVNALPTVTVSATPSSYCAGSSSASLRASVTGLVGYWQFDEGSGSTTADASGNGLNGTLVSSPTWTASGAPVPSPGNALTFNTAYVNVPDNAIFGTLANSFTIESWIYQTDNVNNTIVDRANYNFLFQTGSNGNTGLGFYNPTDGWTYGAGVVPTNVWSHVAMTWDGASKTVKFYLNGALMSSHVRTNPLAFNSGPLNIARQEPNGCQCNIFTGTMDEVRMYNTVRSQAEIQATMNDKLNYSYTWSPSSTLSSSTGATVTATPPVTTTYSITATSGGGCSSIAMVTVTVNSIPAVTVTATPTAICAGSSAALRASVTGLVGYWQFDEGSGSTTADASGNGLNGTLVSSPTWTASGAPVPSPGNALTFNTAYVNVPDNAIFGTLANSFTIESWIYQTDNVDNTIVDRANYNFLFQTGPNGNTGLGFYNPTDGWTYGAGVVPTNVWSHVAMTWDGASKTVKFYLNGSLMSSHVRTNPLAFNSGPLNIARQEPNGCQCNIFTGTMDEVRMYNKVRSQTEIQATMNEKLNYSYTWSPSSTLSASTGATVTASPTVTTTYTITATSGGGCTNTTTLTLTVNPRPVPTFTTSPATMLCVGNVVTYTTQSGQSNYIWSVPGTGGVDYSITSGGIGTSSNSVTVKWLTTGVKTVTVNYTDANGCTGASPATHTATVNPNPTTPTGTSSICVGQTTTFSSTPSGGTWTSSAPGIATIGSASGFITGISSGLSFITYTLSTGCYSVRAVFVNPLPTLAPTNSSPACVGGLVNFTSGGSGTGTTYAWSGPASYTAGVSNPGRSGVALSHAGTYSVTATITSTGCTSTATTTVTINPTPTTTPTNTSPVCIGGTVNFNAVATAVGTLSYSWTGPAGFTSASPTPSRSSVTSAHAGAYVIAVSTPGSGCNATAVTVVTINAIPAAAPTNSSPVCVGSMVTLSANPVSGTGVTGYSWSGPGGFTSTLANPTVTPTTTTTYSLTVTSGGASGCSPSTVYTTIVTVNPMPAAISGGGGTSTFNYTGSIQNFTVPAGVTSVTIQSWGASGANANDRLPSNATGGKGSFVSGTLSVTPGQVLQVRVGGAGSNTGAGGFNGGGAGGSASAGSSCSGGFSGGGGGASDVRIGAFGLSDRIIVAAGGGGSGRDYCNGSCQPCGCGGSGGHGDIDGVPAGNCGFSFGGSGINFGGKGLLVSTSNGGPGDGTGLSGSAGILGVGGNGASGSQDVSGGGGGGGYYGGGGGGGALSGSGVGGGGGGGGSSYIGGVTAGSIVTNSNTGNGIVIISYTSSTNSICVGNTTTLSTTPAGGTWTSGGTGVATVAPLTGVVTGVAGGTATITYALPTGCYVTTVVTVNPLPAAIGGTAVMCAGASVTLTNTVSGGTWSSSNTGIATVGSTTGIVNGVTAGNATITYTLPTGCFAVKTVTVNTTPGSITGTMSACVGATTTLSSSPTGGTWSSSNTGVATVSGSGVVLGVAAGTVTITYMLSTGCYTTASVTINPNPAAITGVMSICAGSTTTLASTTTGGTWSSSMPSVATVGASSGIVTGSIAGTTVITYQLPTGCSTTATVTVNTMPLGIPAAPPVCVGTVVGFVSGTPGGTWSSSNPAMGTISTIGSFTAISAGIPIITYAIGPCFVTRAVTINPNPAAITGTMVLCMGSSTTLTSATTGGMWTSSATGVATIGSASGLLTGVSGGTATITYMMGTGCYTTATVTINTTPSPITGTMTYCAGTTGTLTATPGGGTWTSSSTAMATVSGSGVVSAISAGTPVITYSFGTGCMSIVTLTINPNPAAITGTTTVCAGSITTLATTSTGGTWSSSMPSVATVGATTGIVSGSIAGTTTITYTLPTGCYTTTNVTVNALPVIPTWPGTICVSSTATLTATPAGGTWTSSNTGIATIGVGSGITTGVSAGTAMLTYTSGVGCSSATAVTVNGLPTIATWSGALCVSSTTTLNATPSGGTWSSSMPSVATIGATTGVLSGSIAGTTTITYTLPTGCIATSVATINPLPTAITGIMPICVGGNTTLASTPSGGMWSSSNTGVATVGSTSGVAVGVSAGTAVMTYTLSTGCIMTAVLTVNPLPAAITGITNVCTGFTTALFSASTGGTWSSSNTTLATIGSTTGVVTGHVAGTLTITYTLPTGCLTTTSFTVNPTPAPVSGTLDVCVGLTTTLSTTPAGGTWTSSNPAEATIGGSTGLVTGMSAGMPVMTYTLPTGCRVMAVVTVNPLPAAISGASSVCTGAVTTLSSATTGGTWSSASMGTATVGATTGIVTGVAAGTVTITYMLPTGCIATKAMTVNATPTAITGTLTVCSGYTTALASTPTGGTWSSSNPAAGSVSSAGIVTGITAGMPVITYTLATGCYTTTAISVNQTPPASTGSNQVCIGSTSTLANTLAGGTWSSSNPTIASVTASTGIVSGLVAGTLNITYTMPTGCFIVTPMTVNALPSSISGPGTVCPGATITLGSSPTGGTWTSSNTMIATVGSASGIVTGVAGGNVTISYTLATGCRMTAVITVNPAPNLSSFSLPTATSPCVGNSSLVTLNSASIGSGTYTVTYDLAGANSSTGNTATVVMSSSTGSFTIPSSLLTLTGTQTAIITSITNSFGCSTTLTTGNVASFAVNVLPTVFTVSGGGGYCAGGAGLHIYLSGSTVGVNYQLYNGASPVGGFVAGTSTGLDFGVFTTAGTYTVVATNATTGCVNNMTGSATITINPLPTAFMVTGGGSYCVGGTGVLVGLAGSQTGVNYQLYNGSSTVGGPVSGTGGTISFGLQTGSGTYTVVATDATTMCVSTMSGSVTVVVNPLPTAFTGPTAICEGSTTTLGSTPSGGTWTSSATSIATVASTSGFVTGVSGGTVTITYTLPTGCMMTGVLTVNPLPAAITGASNVCTGSSTTLASTTTGGTWTSSNTAFATVGSTSGSVTGVSAGTVNITYTVGTGCYVIKPMTINLTPAAISGSSTVCTGTTTILTSATTGGTWSSSASSASVIPTTGVVSGVSAGTATITYTLPSGCFVTFPMTVNATPAAIGGTMNVCAGATRTLTNTTSGGTWSSSNITLATVGSTSGIVSGLAAGTVVISYTMPTGCFVITSFTVNPAPAAITGLNNVCLGSTIALSNTTSGGTWSSSSSGTASVTSTGIVTGAATGTATITYTIPGGCFSVYPVTVNPNPATITGTANVCVAASTTLSNATAGGTWTSGNPTIASVGGATGIVTGLAAGTPTISYTLPTGCFAIRVVTVNPNPAAIAGPTNVCTGQSITLTNATGGGTWSSSSTALGTVNATSGVVTGVAVGTPIISYTLGTGCYSTYAVVVNQTPSAITGAPFVCVGTTTTLSNAYGGGTWTSSNPTLATVGASTGLVSGLATGMPIITYSLPPGCITTMVISVNPTPATITGTMNVCVGSTTILSNATGGGIWSSGNPGVATITGSTGMVSGISAGTANITYTLPGGCIAVATVTVNPLPAPIAGTDNVCEGLSTTLTNTSGGGTWTSSNTLVATVGSASGVVTGLSAGAITITYTLPTSCFITTPFTVNPLPASITGTAVVCVNATTTLSDATTGGLWSSSSPAIATIGSASGVVTGVTTGSAIITYTLPTGCMATRIVTVNPLPTIYVVTGGGGFCTGGTGVVVGLSGSNTGINYQLYNGSAPTGTPVAGTGASLSFGLITVAGTYTVKATNAVTGCFVNMSGTATVYGIPLPIQYTVTGGGSYCAGGSGFAVGLASSQPGVNYQLYNGATLMGAPLLGSGAPISFGTQTLAGTYAVVATNTSGCVSGMLGSVNIIVNPIPTAFTVTGGGAYCSGGSGAVVGLSGSTTGINYQLYRGTTLVTTVSGTGSSISFGAMTVAGTYNVVAVNASTGCTNNMSGSVSVTISSLPVSTYTVGGGGAFCFGSAGVNVTLSNSDAGVNYQLLLGGSPVGSAMSGIGSSLNFGPQTTAGTYTIQATSTSTGCVAAMTGSVSVTVNPLPIVQFITGGGSYCAGGTGPAIGISGSQSGVSYRLIRDGATLVTTVAGMGSAFSFGAQSVAGTYTIVAVNATTTCSVNMSGSTVISINPLPTAFTVTGGGGYCIGGSGVAVMLSGSQTGVNYQLFLGSTAVGSPVAGTGAAISFGNQTTGGTYTVVATIVGTGCVTNMSGSVAVTVNPLPTAYTVTGGGVYCTGGSGVAVGVANSQTNVNYQLFLGTSPVGSAVAGTTGSAISFGLQTTTGTYTVVATNAITGCVNNMTGSVTISVTSLPSMYLVTGGGSYCIGGSGVAIGLSGSQTGVSYRLYNGTTPVGSAISGTGGILSFGLQTAAGTYTVVATATSSCSSNMLGSVVVNINSLPTLFTVTGGGSYCTGGTGVSVGLSSSLAGTSYQLFRGTTPVGTPVSGTGLALNFGLMTVTGTYTVFATDLTTGCTQTMAGSVNVATNPLPTTYTVSGGGSYCSGGTGVAVGLGGSQSGVRYQLYRGSTAVGSTVAGTGSAISFGMQTTAGTYSVIATDTATFCTRNMTGSVTVSVSALPNIYTMTGGGGFCTGGTGVAIGLTGSQAGVTYRLYLGGSTPIGSAISGTGAAISFGTHTLGGTYTVVATSTSSACTSNMSGSAVITVNPLPTIFAVTGGGGYCSGGSGAGIGLANSTVGVNYQLYRGTTAVGAPVAGTGSPLNFGLFTTTGTYTVSAVTAATGCSRNMSGSAVVSVSSLPTAFSVTGGGSYCSGGAGVVVALSGSNTGISYQLFRGTTAVGSPVTGTGTAINFGLQTVAGTYTVMAVNTTTSCGRNMTGSATVVVNAAPAAFTVTGGGSYCTGSTGLAIGLSGSASGVTYRLYRGTTLVATLSGTGSTLSFGTFTTAGTYTVIATGSTTCTTTMTGSAVITVNALPAAFTVTGGGSYCAGGSGLNIGLSGSASGVSYQLMRGTTTVGSAMAGTGSALSFGLQTIAGTYTVVAVNATTGCTSAMTGSATISIIAAPTVYTVTGGGAYCSGPGHNIYLSGSQTGVSYRLYLGTSAIGSPVSGTGSAINFGTFTTVGTYTVIATTGSSSCTMTMSGSASITSGSLPNLYSVTGGGSFCAGGAGYAVGLSGSQTGVNYQLYRGTTAVGAPVAGTGGALSFGTMSIAGGYTVVATNPTTGCIRSMSGSATIVVNALPTTFSLTGGGAYCSGGTGVTIGLSGSATGVSYKLYRGTVLVSTVSGTGSAISFGLHTTAGTYTVVATNVSTGCTSNMSGSATVSVNATPTISGSIYTVAPAGSITLSGSPSGGAWSSSATSVATVGSSSGVVSGMSLGTTTISYTMSTGCRATRTVSVTPTGHRDAAPESATGIVATNNNHSSIYVVPNPNKGVFTVKGTLSTLDEVEVTIELTNMLGQVMHTGKALVKNGELSEVVRLSSSVANGMYLLNVNSPADSRVIYIVVEQ